MTFEEYLEEKFRADFLGKLIRGRDVGTFVVEDVQVKMWYDGSFVNLTGRKGERYSVGSGENMPEIIEDNLPDDYEVN